MQSSQQPEHSLSEMKRFPERIRYIVEREHLPNRTIVELASLKVWFNFERRIPKKQISLRCPSFEAKHS